MTPENPTDPSAFVIGTNYREIHKNEADALRSIYSNDFEDVEMRRAAWQVSVARVYSWIHAYRHTYLCGYLRIDTHGSGN